MANEQKWISKQKAACRLDVCAKTIDRLRARRELETGVITSEEMNVLMGLA